MLWPLATRSWPRAAILSGSLPRSTTYAEPSIEDYAQRTTQTVASWTSMNGKQASMNGKQGGDPVKLADAYRDLSSSLAHDDD